MRFLIFNSAAVCATSASVMPCSFVGSMRSMRSMPCLVRPDAQATTPDLTSSWIDSSSRPSRSRSTGTVCWPMEGTSVSGPSATFDILIGIARHEDGLVDAVGAGQLDQHVPMGHVGVVDHVRGVVAGRRGEPAAGQHAGRLALGLVGRPLFDGRPDDPFEVGPPALAGGEALLLGPFGVPDQVGQPLELVLAHHLHHEPAVGAAEGVEDEREALLLVGLAPLPHRPVVHGEVTQRDHGVEHGDVDVLSEPGGVAVTECGQHADDAEHPGPGVAQPADRRDHRGLVGAAGVLVDARHGLGDRGVGRPLLVRGEPVVPEARNGEVDQLGMIGAHRLVVDAQPLRLARSQVLAHHVGRRTQVEDELAAPVRLEVDGHALLAQVVAQEGGPDLLPVLLGHRRRRGPSGVAPTDLFHLDHLGAQARHELGGEREGLHLLECEHPHAVERAPELAGLVVRRVTELHASPPQSWTFFSVARAW